jgi:4-diphosphocytidyl-2-C-methyl-D-erythritol kinase
MEELKVKTPAKINLGLHIISKRNDEYHNIETIFYPVKLFDILTFKKSDNFRFTTDNKELNGSSNLIVKAKELIETESKQKINIHIHLEKKIPIGAGLGGGSSDAAAVLKTLKKIFKLNIDRSKLDILALRLGSDVPFFLNPKPSYASSKGESLQKRELKINHPILLVNPGIHISTKWAYSKVTPKTPEFNLKDLSQEHLDAPQKFKKYLKNDFEEVVIANFPEIKKFKNEILETGAIFTQMSGSGSTFYSIYKNYSSAQKALEKLSGNYFTYLHRYEE